MALRRLARLLAASMMIIPLVAGAQDRDGNSSGAPDSTVGPDTLVVEIRLDGVDQRIAKVVRQGNDLLLPIAVVLDLVGERQWADSLSELVSLDRVRAHLATSVTFDASELVVHITPNAEMPVMRQRAREKELAARGSLLLTQSASTFVTPPASGVLSLDYEVFGSNAAQSQPSYLVRGGLGIAGGELSGTFVSAGNSTSRDVAWSRVRPGTPFVSRVQLGSNRTLGIGTEERQVVGISIGNAPTYRPFAIDYRRVTGTLPTGWTIDAYRSNELFAFDSVGTDGRYAFNVPIGYGHNLVNLVAYGPDGERVSLQRYVRLAPSMLGKGQSEYSVTFGRCVRETCSVAGSAGGRIGLFSALTVEGGMLYERSAFDSTRVDPYGALRAQLTRNVHVEVEGVSRALRRVAARFDPSPLSGVEALWLNTPMVTEGTGVSVTRASFRLDAWSALTARAAISVRAQLSHTPDPLLPRTHLTLGTSHSLGQTQWRPFLTTHVLGDRTDVAYAGLELLVMPSHRWPALLRGTGLRSLVEFDNLSGQLQRVESTLSRQVGRDFRVETEAQWSRALAGPAVALRLVTHTPAIRARAQARRSATGERAGMEYSAGGSLIADPGSSRVALSSEPSYNRSGISILAFLDRNADGVRQADERGVANAGIVIGNRVVRTNGAGRAYLWGAAAFEPVAVSVDSLTIPPHWHAPPAVFVQVRGAETARIDLPLTPGTTVEGTVSGLDIAPERLTLVLRERRSARQVPVELFRDGSFYLMSVAPGTYTLTVTVKGGPSAPVQQVSFVVPLPDATKVGDAARVVVDLAKQSPRTVVPPKP